MSEIVFPSGPWIGFYVHSTEQQRRHRMDLILTFAAKQITGSGSDDIGKLVICGHYDGRSGECYWTKTYVGVPDAEDIYYRGFREGKGIWGTWEIGQTDHGGFHIWPAAHGIDLDEARRQERNRPAPDRSMDLVLIPV